LGLRLGLWAGVSCLSRPAEWLRSGGFWQALGIGAAGGAVAGAVGWLVPTLLPASGLWGSVGIGALTQTLAYTYTADGLRVAENAGGEAATFVWDLASPLAQVLATSDGAAYVHGLDLVAERRSGAWAYPLGDALGSVRQWTDEDGYVDYAGGYTPFGTQMWTEGSTSSSWGYTGEWWDARVGMVYLRARWYEPGVGRSGQVDPWEGDYRQPQSLHPYVYVRNDPQGRTDPTGRYDREEVHYGLTKRWALGITRPLLGSAGEYLAELISRGDRWMDVWPIAVRQDLHFVGPGTASGNADTAIGLGNPYVFGATLHQVQDLFSHYYERYRFPGEGHIRHSAQAEYLRDVSQFFDAHPRPWVEARLSAIYPGVDFSRDPTGREDHRPPFADNELIDLYLREWPSERDTYGYRTDDYYPHTYRDRQMEWETRRLVLGFVLQTLTDSCRLIKVLAH
jgi:RHS repeat-associated protein